MTTFKSDTKIILSEEFKGLLLKYAKNNNTLFIIVSNISSDETHYLGDFLSSFRDLNDINEELLPAVEDVLNMNLLNEVISSQLLCAYIEREYTYFTEDNDLKKGKQNAMKNPNMFISTSKFKEVSKKWVNFLEKFNETNERTDNFSFHLPDTKKVSKVFSESKLEKLFLKELEWFYRNYGSKWNLDDFSNKIKNNKNKLEKILAYLEKEEIIEIDKNNKFSFEILKLPKIDDK